MNGHRPVIQGTADHAEKSSDGQMAPTISVVAKSILRHGFGVLPADFATSTSKWHERAPLAVCFALVTAPTLFDGEETLSCASVDS